jgi:hypothetical protein
MELNEIITNSVNAELSQFGLNEVERKDFETIIQTEVSALEETADKEEYVKKRAKDFQASAKLIQKSRTKLAQDKASLEAQLEELKKGGEKKDEKKENPSELEATLTKLMQPVLDQVKSLKEDNEKLKQQEKIKECKQKILDGAKSKYAEGVITISAKNFDFSADDAGDKFEALCAENSTILGVPLKKGEKTPKDDIPSELKDFLKGESLKAEEEKKRAESFEQRFKGK